MASVRLFVFYLSHGLVWVCEIELSYMGKNKGNPDLVTEKCYSISKAADTYTVHSVIFHVTLQFHPFHL